jgi:hypothetical protein
MNPPKQDAIDDGPRTAVVRETRAAPREPSAFCVESAPQRRPAINSAFPCRHFYLLSSAGVEKAPARRDDEKSGAPDHSTIGA